MPAWVSGFFHTLTDMTFPGGGAGNPSLLLPRSEISRTPPAGATAAEIRLVARERATAFDEVFEHEFSNCVVWAFPLLEWRGRKIWDPSSGEHRINPRAPFSVRRWLGAFKYPSLKQRKCLLFFTHHCAFSVYHWLCDAFPRLILLARRHGWDCPALLTQETSVIRRYQERSLEWLGFSGPVIRTRFDRGVRVRRLVTCDLVAPLGHHRPELIRFVRDQIRLYFEREITEPRELVYISRSNARCRRSANEPEVVQLLEKFGFRIVHLERLAPDDQVRATLNARLIVGNHGGGLPSLIYAPFSCKLLEIRSQTDDRNNCYYTLAHALGNEYHLHLARPCQPERGLDSDYELDIAGLKRKLDELLSSAS